MASWHYLCVIFAPHNTWWQNRAATPNVGSSDNFLRVDAIKKFNSNLLPVRLFTCNIWVLIKRYLSNYNGVIKATPPPVDSVPCARLSRGGRRGPIRSGSSDQPGPLHWTPTPALSISISFLSQYVSRWRPMQDRCFNIGSALTYNNYRSVQPPFKPPALPSFRSLRLRRRPRFAGGFYFLFRPPSR